MGDKSKINNMMAGARKLLDDCLGLRKGENLLIVADIDNMNVAQALFEAGRQRETEAVVLIMNTRRAHGEDPPVHVAEAMKSADAAVLATVFSLSHSNARKQANMAGTRIISIPGCREDVLISGGIEANFISLSDKVRKTGELLSQAKLIELTSAQGTNLQIGGCGRKSVDQTGLARERGSWSPAPIIETAVGPETEAVNGTAVIDGVIIPGGQIKDPVVLTFEKGRIADIKGKGEARRFKQLLESFNDPNVYRIVEFGIGLNPRAKMGKGLMTDDESEFGTVHLGLGEGRTFGVPISAPAHIDLVMRKPVVTLDGTLFLSDNQFLSGPFRVGKE